VTIIDKSLRFSLALGFYNIHQPRFYPMSFQFFKLLIKGERLGGPQESEKISQLRITQISK